MAEKRDIVTGIKYDGSRAKSEFDGHPPIEIVGLSRIEDSAEAWSPPYLFIASIESCFFTTLLAIAEKMRVGIETFSSKTIGLLASSDGRHKEFTEVIIRPEIIFKNENDRAKLEHLLKLAEEHCFVTRSVKMKVTVEIQGTKI